MRAEFFGAVQSGNPGLLGATPLQAGTNFSFYTGAAALAVQVCIYRQENIELECRYDLTATEPVEQDGHIVGNIWHGLVPNVKEGDLYGFRVDGPFAPEKGYFFNPNKLLVDPCAREVTHEIHQWDPRHFPHNFEDNADIMPKGRVINWRALQGQTRTGAIYAHNDSIIYETHVKGATILHPDIPREIRGTYKALAHPAFMNWVKDMGITTLELMPVGSFGTDVGLAQRGTTYENGVAHSSLTNYWGYMPMTPMAPHTGYSASNNPLRDFRKAISTLRKNGIEVILDVVPNHTLESGNDGPILNLRGMDSTLYLPNDYTGTGNTRDFGHPMNIRFFFEELRHWISLGVSGFRIDLATVAGRVHGSDFDPDSPMMRIIREDPVLHNVKFYGEPWDCGPNGVQLGRLSFIPPKSLPNSNTIAEWDPGCWEQARREALTRAAVCHREVPRSWIISVMAGESLQPYARVIKIVSHDGPTLADMVSFTAKRNDANRDNGGGNDINPDGFWITEKDRLRVQRFAFSLLAITQGVPMITMGHERCKSQGGNTNPYCQDNDTTYLPWKEAVSPEGRDLMAFAKNCNAFRATHPSLRRATLFTGQTDPDSGLTYDGNPMKDVTWLDPAAEELSGKGAIEWPGGFGMLLSGDPGNSPSHEKNTTRLIMRQGRDSPLLALINPTQEDLDFKLPDVEGILWTPVLNSLKPDEMRNNTYLGSHTVKVGYHAMIIFEGTRNSTVKPVVRPRLSTYLHHPEHPAKPSPVAGYELV